jgi:hypothetical protein
MSNYTQTTFFTPKDSLPAGNPAKTIFGAAYDVEFGNIAIAIASKLDGADSSPVFTSTVSITAAGSNSTSSLDLNSALPLILFDNTSASANTGQWQMFAGTTGFTLRSTNDAYSTQLNQINIMRPSGLTVTEIQFGNTTDNAGYQFLGTGVFSTGGTAEIGGSLTVAGSSTLTGDVVINAIGAGSGAYSLELSSTLPMVNWVDTGAPTDNGKWQMFSGAGTWTLRSTNDAFTVQTNAINVVRASAEAITTMQFGNATDNPGYQFLGTGGLSSGGLITGGSNILIASSTTLANGAGSSTGTLTNAPAAGNPTKWVEINDNGTTRKIPAW